MKRTHSTGSTSTDRSVGHGPDHEAGHDTRDAFLTAMGERVRMLRAHRGMTRRTLASETGLSERHLANLESGVGNPSVLVLRQIAETLHCPLAELTGDATTSSAEWLLVRELLLDRDEATLQQARLTLAAMFAQAPRDPHRHARIALIGLAGVGKSTLGSMLARQLKAPFVELTQAIARLAGCPAASVLSLHGASAFEQYEQRALDATIAAHPRAVIACPGSIVCRTATFDGLLAHCFTVWLQASPDEHLRRVAAPTRGAASWSDPASLDAWQRVLAARSERYGRADMIFDTSGAMPADACRQLAERLAARIAAELRTEGDLIG